MTDEANCSGSPTYSPILITVWCAQTNQLQVASERTAHVVSALPYFPSVRLYPSKTIRTASASEHAARCSCTWFLNLENDTR